MIEVTLTVDKAEVYEEVAKTTSYTGAKMDDEDAYDRIFTTDEDQEMLERFWDEAKNSICNSTKRVLGSETEEDGVYSLALNLSTSFDESLTDSMERSLFSFFVTFITSKWYTFTNKAEAKDYALNAAALVEDIMRKAYFKKRPTRPTYD